MITKVDGIVISEVKYRETSKIINVLTKNGIIGIIAKGACRSKSIYHNLTNKLTYATFHINKREGLSSLIEVDLIDNFKNIRKSLEKISYAMYISDLVTQVYKHDNNENIYKLYLDSLIKINEGYDEIVISNILELKLLDFLGIKPVLDKCVICNNTHDIVTLSSYLGGYVCKKCYNNELLVSTNTIKLIRMFYYIDISKITKIDIGNVEKKEISNFLSDYYDRYSGLYLQTKSFLNKIGCDVNE